ncbi:aldo/keto reductase [Nakamurella sp. YIM 132087]|uniref:Aldo/keto reductase n=1 Tax=Nakamurella alba TaxID=2665158 RepID=A0A7K1FGR3_9ACTN|nr:aldo/keto reductase [Nakamurella alba]MTD12669.1 aldo/keto reductase [Nakamurella alba]
MSEPTSGAPVTVPTKDLSDGTTIPALGFGVWRVEDDVAETAVGQALDAGYRLIDTASMYQNETGVGRAIASAADRGITYDDIYLTTKVNNADQGYDETLRAFDVSAQKLGIDVLDLYLIHWPLPARGQYLDTWKALVQLKADGKVKSIGVCNFLPEHLEVIIGETGVAPSINQIELHPYLQQKEAREFHAKHGIVTEDWSPLGAGDNNLLADPTLIEIAARNGVSPAQAVLAWHLAIGSVVIPKSVTPSRIVENLVAATVTLPAEDLGLINGLDKGARTGPDPATFNPS